MTSHSADSEARLHRRQILTRLLRRDSIGEAYHVLTFDVPEGLAAGAGHFVMVRGAEWGEAPLLPRPMSLLTAGTTPSILIKVIGEGTRRMARAEPGEPFSLLAPLGNTWRPVTPGRRPLLVAGGVGIAPLLFLAREFAAQNLRPIAIYGGRTERDLPLYDELAQVAELHLVTENGGLGTRGRVTDLMPDLLDRDVEVYTCGPDRMMAKVAEIAASRNVRCQVSLETPMACGYGVCLGCPVPKPGGEYLYACTHGPCVDATEIDWSRSAHAPRKSADSGTQAAHAHGGKS
jgi:dihydroorotate dehydrogenase electron transfer subunit